MKQIIQNLRTGKTILEDVPAPRVIKGHILIQSSKSLVSAGTEKMLVNFAKAGLVEKIKSQPERVKQVLDKMKTDGLIPVLKAVASKLDQSVSLGYCNVGRVIDIGEGVFDIHIGDRVVSNGPHAEIVCVARNLVAKIPDQVSDEEAVFTIVGAIGLHAVRLLAPALGETVVVIGLGLIGLLTAELLLLSGCRVIGFDPDEKRLKLAEQKGVQICHPESGNPEKFVTEFTAGTGADGVIITASAIGNAIISQAAKVSRKRGRIILTGVVGLNLVRKDFYEKELTFQVSCSYGPGRYDSEYENRGIDYPVSYVRWTENRNFETVLQLLGAGSLDVKQLISETVPITEYSRIYDNMGSSNSMGTIFDYPVKILYDQVVKYNSKSFSESGGIIGIIGAGNFTSATLLPALKNAKIKYIASSGGLSAALLARKYNIPFSTSNYKMILSDTEVDLVVITTRHDQHAEIVIEALRSGKHVFVEKPLAIFPGELNEIIHAWSDVKYLNGSLTVGFNRRFSPFVQKMKRLLGPAVMNIIITVNAGTLPENSWQHDHSVGGGRIIGEACHFIDLVGYVADARITAVFANAMGSNPSQKTDCASVFLKCANGSVGAIHYFSNGSKEYTKERIEVHAQARTLVLDNFTILKGYGFKNFSKMTSSQNKGHRNQFKTLLDRVRNGGEAFMSFDEIVNTTKATFAVLESLRRNGWVNV